MPFDPLYRTFLMPLYDNRTSSRDLYDNSIRGIKQFSRKLIGARFVAGSSIPSSRMQGVDAEIDCVGPPHLRRDGE